MVLIKTVGDITGLCNIDGCWNWKTTRRGKSQWYNQQGETNDKPVQFVTFYCNYFWSISRSNNIWAIWTHPRFIKKIDKYRIYEIESIFKRITQLSLPKLHPNTLILSTGVYLKMPFTPKFSKTQILISQDELTICVANETTITIWDID